MLVSGSYTSITSNGVCREEIGLITRIRVTQTLWERYQAAGRAVGAFGSKAYLLGAFAPSRSSMQTWPAWPAYTAAMLLMLDMVVWLVATLAWQVPATRSWLLSLPLWLSAWWYRAVATTLIVASVMLIGFNFLIIARRLVTLRRHHPAADAAAIVTVAVATGVVSWLLHMYVTPAWQGRLPQQPSRRALGVVHVTMLLIGIVSFVGEQFAVPTRRGQRSNARCHMLYKRAASVVAGVYSRGRPVVLAGARLLGQVLRLARRVVAGLWSCIMYALRLAGVVKLAERFVDWRTPPLYFDAGQLSIPRRHDECGAYRRFFDAVWRNDVPTIRRLAAPKHVPSASHQTNAGTVDTETARAPAAAPAPAPAQAVDNAVSHGTCLVATFGPSRLTTLSMAVVLGRCDAVKVLLQLAQEQYAPPDTAAARAALPKPDRPPPLINNIDLVKSQVGLVPCDCHALALLTVVRVDSARQAWTILERSVHAGVLPSAADEPDPLRPTLTHCTYRLGCVRRSPFTARALRALPGSVLVWKPLDERHLRVPALWAHIAQHCGFGRNTRPCDHPTCAA